MQPLSDESLWYTFLDMDGNVRSIATRGAANLLSALVEVLAEQHGAPGLFDNLRAAMFTLLEGTLSAECALYFTDFQCHGFL